MYAIAYARPAAAGSLQWTVADDCPDVEALRAELARVLVDPERMLAGLAIEAVIIREQAGSHTLLLQMSSTDVAGKPAVRELRAATCQELVEAAAVAIALAAESASSHDTSAAAVVPATDAEKVPALAAESPSPAASWLLGASALFDTDAVSTPGFGAELQLALTYSALRAELAAGWFPPRTLSFSPAGQVESSLLVGQVRGCGQLPLWDSGALVYACGTFELGRRSSQLLGSARGPVNSAWRAAGVGLGGSVRLASRWALAGSVDLLWALTRISFSSQGSAVFWPTLTTWRAQLGVVFQL
jgi:hypothetical protein